MITDDELMQKLGALIEVEALQAEINALLEIRDDLMRQLAAARNTQSW